MACVVPAWPVAMNFIVATLSCRLWFVVSLHEHKYMYREHIQCVPSLECYCLCHMYICVSIVCVHVCVCVCVYV